MKFLNWDTKSLKNYPQKLLRNTYLLALSCPIEYVDQLYIKLGHCCYQKDVDKIRPGNNQYDMFKKLFYCHFNLPLGDLSLDLSRFELDSERRFELRCLGDLMISKFHQLFLPKSFYINLILKFCFKTFYF